MENEDLKELLNKTLELFFKYGVRSITMDDLASRLGVSKKTIYTHVENKADLIEKVMRLYIDEQQHACERIVSEEQNAIEQLNKTYHSNLDSMSNISHTLIFELKKYYGAIWQSVDAFKKNFLQESIYENILLGQEQGLFRKSLNARIISIIYTNRIDMLVDGDLFPSSKFSFREVIQELYEYHIRGIATAAGIQFLESQKRNF